MFVKICGITRIEDALLAVALGADAIGFVFAPSKRQVAPQRVREIASRIPREVLTVGVFRNESPERVVKIVHEAGLKAAQLHGSESSEETRWVTERVPATIKAFPAGSEAVAKANEFGVSTILLDAPQPGSGEVFDWKLSLAVPLDLQMILAGGLNPDNVGTAISKVNPWGVDVSSGVEKSPGIKDPVLMRRFIEKAKATETSGEEIADDPGAEDEPYDWQGEQR